MHMTIEHNAAAAAIEQSQELLKIITDAQTAGTGLAEKLVKMTVQEKIDINNLDYMGNMVDMYA
ncbi:MAG: hypothetical protein JW874_15985 [Spirochaetales bacterium]|nr:hypothetical protein [Spirochaetales bacterium]